jgi:hypothetical protein
MSLFLLGALSMLILILAILGALVCIRAVRNYRYEQQQQEGLLNAVLEQIEHEKQTDKAVSLAKDAGPFVILPNDGKRH